MCLHYVFGANGRFQNLTITSMMRVYHNSVCFLAGRTAVFALLKWIREMAGENGRFCIVEVN
jgi:hypothetical protein